MRRLAMRQQELGGPLTNEEREEVLRSAPLEVARPVAFGVGINHDRLLPILTLEGIEGKLFKPDGTDADLRAARSLILALTVTPVTGALFCPGQLKGEGAVAVRLAHGSYECRRWIGRAVFENSRCSGNGVVYLRVVIASRMGESSWRKLGGRHRGNDRRLAGNLG